MKKIILLSLFLLLGLSRSAFAHDDSHDKAMKETSFQSGYIGVGGGVDLTSASWNNTSVTYGLGAIGDVFGGFQLDKSFAVQAEVQNFLTEGAFAGNIISQYNLRGLLEAKYAFDMPVCQPYLLAGGGLVYSVLNQPTSLGIGYTTAVNADALAGLGAQFELSASAHLYVEAKYNFILTATTSFQDIPITAGIWTGF
jgi:Outer membrane protein beta-barrel domain